MADPAPAGRAGAGAAAGTVDPPHAVGEARGWHDLPRRARSAALLLPPALLCMWLGGPAWAALVAAALLVMAWEWVRVCGFVTRRLPGTLVPLATLLACGLAAAGLPGAALGLAVAGAAAVFGLAALPGGPGGRRAAAWLGFGVGYLGLAGVALIWLRADPVAGAGNVLFLFLVIWASDIGAYLVGRRLGGARLAPAVSPNKTWAGASGGLAAAVAAGLAAAYVMGGLGEAVQGALAASLLGVLTQAGDLFESWMKRRFHVKDTSSLIPGHGGLLDRLDGVLAAAPAAALLALLAGPGSPLWR